MSLRNQLKAALPPSWWMFAGFCKRLPAYWRLDRSESLRVKQNVAGLPLFVTPDIFVHIPESVTALVNWRLHAIEDPAGSIEIENFLELATGCSSFIDIGAQTGFLSALFARSRLAPTRILSIEPDPQVHPILARARELNLSPGSEWEIRHLAVADEKGIISVPTSNSLYESRGSLSKLGAPIEVAAESLRSLLESLAWTPDILKIDVESFEFEILVPSLSLFAGIKPALQLEVHWELLAKRHRNPFAFLGPLHEIGYRGIRQSFRGLREWERSSKRDSVSRLSLKVD